MSRPIDRIPLSELQSDLQDSIEDIEICSRALAVGVTHHRDGLSVQYRIDRNRQIIEVIEAELGRRSRAESQSPS